jgi:hypothetical protein
MLFGETYFVTLPRQFRLSCLYFKILWHLSLSYVYFIAWPARNVRTDDSVYQIDIQQGSPSNGYIISKKSAFSHPKILHDSALTGVDPPSPPPKEILEKLNKSI